MPVVNPLARELVFKVVYYGPGLGGKTTTLQHIHATTRAEHRGKMVSLATPVDRTLYFDFLPLRLATLHGMGVRLQLFTVPGQVYYNATRKLVLTGADAVVFVADSQRGRLDANLESLENLRDNLAEHGRFLDELPFLLAYNKRDLGDIVPVEEMQRRLNRHGAPYFETCATSGVGVFEALDALARLVLEDFERRMPEAQAQMSPGGFRLAEGGLIEALRGADRESERDAPRVFRNDPGAGEAPPVGESAALAVVGDGNRVTLEEPGHAADPQPPSDPFADADLGTIPETVPDSESLLERESTKPTPLKPDLLRPEPIFEVPWANGAAVQTAAAPRSPRVSAGIRPNGVTSRPREAATQHASVVAAPVAAASAPAVSAVAASSMAGPAATTTATTTSSVSAGPTPPGSGALSFVVLWSEEDRAIAREVEGNLQRAEWAAAVLGCGALVRRCLARATPEGEGDTLAVVLLALRIDAARYLWLRRQIMETRGGATPERTVALGAYLFAVDVARRVHEIAAASR